MSVSWRQPIRNDRLVAAIWAISAAGALALRPLWLAAAALSPPCAWHRWTGVPCPGCGTTRAVVRLLHGDALGGLAMNPLAVVATGAFITVGLTAPVWLAAGGSVPVLASKPRPGWIAAAGVALIANWAWLCASGV